MSIGPIFLRAVFVPKEKKSAITNMAHSGGAGGGSYKQAFAHFFFSFLPPQPPVPIRRSVPQLDMGP